MTKPESFNNIATSVQHHRRRETFTVVVTVSQRRPSAAAAARHQIHPEKTGQRLQRKSRRIRIRIDQRRNRIRFVRRRIVAGESRAEGRRRGRKVSGKRGTTFERFVTDPSVSGSQVCWQKSATLDRNRPGPFSVIVKRCFWF